MKLGKIGLHLSHMSASKNDNFSATIHGIMMYHISNKITQSYTKDPISISSIVLKWQDIEIGSPKKQNHQVFFNPILCGTYVHKRRSQIKKIYILRPLIHLFGHVIKLDYQYKIFAMKVSASTHMGANEVLNMSLSILVLMPHDHERKICVMKVSASTHKDQHYQSKSLTCCIP